MYGVVWGTSPGNPGLSKLHLQRTCSVQSVARESADVSKDALSNSVIQL